LGGDPFCGAKLGNLLMDAGFMDIKTRVISIHLDKRTPKTRIEAMKEGLALMLSASGQLLKSKQVTKELIKDVEKEWEAAIENPDAVLFYSVMQAKGRVL